MLRADPPKSHYEKLNKRRGKVNEEMAARVTSVVVSLKNFPRMRAEAPAEDRRLTFRCRAKRHYVTVVIVRADQMMFL